MKLSECLNAADIATLRGVANHYNLSCSRHSKLALMQEILYTFQSKSFLHGAMREWTEGRDYVMLRLALESRQLFSPEELAAVFAASGADGQWEEALEEGWLFPTTRYGGRLMYCIPTELHRWLRSAIVQQFAEKLVTASEGPLIYQDEETALSRDVDVFLEYVRNHDVRLTTDGSMYKRHLTQVLELLEIPEAPLQGGWRFGYGRRFHDYPDRFALLYDYSYHTDLVSEDADGFLRLSEGVQAWMTQSAKERQRALVRFYLSLYRRPIQRLPQIALLLAHTAHRWTASEAMFAALSDFVQPYYYDSPEQIWQIRILKMFRHLGLIRIGDDENGQTWFQITELGQQLLTPDALPGSQEQTAERQRILIVQPNFEIVVTADQPTVTANLSLFAELRQAGVLRIYRMTEESIRKGVAAGRSLQQWLTFLHNHSQTPVPGNVERTIEEWDRLWAASPDNPEEDTLTS